jgi:hexaprenyl-diphosphate synthase
VEGEFMQLRNGSKKSNILSALMSSLNPSLDTKEGVEARLKSSLDYYLDKTYLKTASLIALSCRASAVLGNCHEDVCQAAYDYGKSIGIAFQLIDDMLDFIVSADEFGKPVNADLSLGLATAPVLYAAETHAELWPLIERKFNQQGDVDRVSFHFFHGCTERFLMHFLIGAIARSSK